jgi:hypothetical protein
VEVWYSGTREVIRLQDGRIAGAAGTTTEWREVVLPPLPSWSALAKRGEYQWVRVRDVMPGYRFGVKDLLSAKVIQAPQKSALQAIEPASLTWFEERVLQSESHGSQSEEALPPARYALAIAGGKEEIVYGEQCLAVTFCFSWQRWPAEMARPDDKK